MRLLECSACVNATRVFIVDADMLIVNKLYHLIKKNRYEVSDFALDELQAEIEESLYHYGLQKTIEDAFEELMHSSISDKKRAVSYLAEIAARIKDQSE